MEPPLPPPTSPSHPLADPVDPFLTPPNLHPEPITQTVPPPESPDLTRRFPKLTLATGIIGFLLFIDLISGVSILSRFTTPHTDSHPVIISPTPTPSVTQTVTPSLTPLPTVAPIVFHPTIIPTSTPKPKLTPTNTPSPTSTPQPSHPTNPTCSSSSIAPPTGPAPLQVTLFGSGDGGYSGGITGYQWDFDGNGSWDTDEGSISLNPQDHTYTDPGTYHPIYRVKGTNGNWSDTCGYPYEITVTQ